MVNPYAQIGSLYQKNNQIKLAKKYYQIALEIFEKYGDTYNKENVLNQFNELNKYIEKPDQDDQLTNIVLDQSSFLNELAPRKDLFFDTS